jgi:TonB-dependent receptor
MRINTQTHIRLIATAAALAMPLTAHAQTSPKDDSPSFGAAGTADAAAENAATDILVTGIRRSNEAAINSKRAALNITDVISATEARALPDNTIVEALRRVPGVSVLPAIDNEHPRDEASTPVIRGLGSTYNNVTIDGLTIASPGTPNGNLGSVTRGVRLDILPSSMISEIDVVKTFTADLDPNAIGGAINLRTRSAFENGGRPFFTMEASLGHNDDTGRPSSQPDPGFRITSTGSTTFGNDGQFGLVVSANYQKLSSFTQAHMTTDTVFYNFYDSAGKLQSGNNLGNGFAVPQQDKYWYVQDQRSRYGVTGKLEARPSDSFYAFVMGGYYFFQDDMTRNEMLIDARNAPVLNQTATSGTYAAGDIEVGVAAQKMTSRTRVAQTGFDWSPGDRQVLAVRGGYSYATYREPGSMIKYIAGTTRPAPGAAGAGVTPSAPFGFTYNTSNFNHFFPVDTGAFYNLNNYSLFYWRPDFLRKADDKVWTGRVDYRFNQGSSDRGIGFAVGGSYTDDRPSYSVSRDEFDPNTSAPSLNLGAVAGNLGAPLIYNPGLNLLTIDPARAAALLSSLPKSAFNQTNQIGFSNQDNFTHHEKIGDAYAMVSYRSDKLTAQAGVRYDHTSQSTVGRLRSATGAYVDNPTSSTYDRLLPSVIATYHATTTIDLRGAFSQTIGRPPYDSYAARSSITFVNTSDIGNPNASGVSVTLGNPNIRPRLSDNFDLALDWRIPGKLDGLISIALFDKEIHDEIFTLSSLGYTDPTSGVTYRNAVVSTPVNANSARIRGAELNGIINSFGGLSPILSGFGASANLALLDGKLGVPLTAGGTRDVNRLVNQPSYTLNGTVFYNMQGLELRAAFNRQGRALRSVVNDISWQDLYWAPRSQVDLSATYEIRKGIQLIGQVSNVTHSRITTVTGPGKNLLKDSYSVPTTFWLGIRVTPKL